MNDANNTRKTNEAQGDLYEAEVRYGQYSEIVLVRARSPEAAVKAALKASPLGKHHFATVIL